MPSQVTAALDLVVKLLSDPDSEVRAQAAKVLGEKRYSKAFEPLENALNDSSPRVRFFSAISLGKFPRVEAMPALYKLLKENADADPYVRHAGVFSLSRIADVPALLAAAHNESRAVRMGVLLALRRLRRAEIAVFLEDSDPALVLEAARAINDEPITGATEELAGLIDSPAMNRFLRGVPLVPPGVDKEAAPGLGLEALLRRALNANFHFGTQKTAQALASFAARSEAPEKMRVEALTELADWEHPAGIDRGKVLVLDDPCSAAPLPSGRGWISRSAGLSGASARPSTRSRVNSSSSCFAMPTATSCSRPTCRSAAEYTRFVWR
jgi:hypothetical protein